LYFGYAPANNALGYAFVSSAGAINTSGESGNAFQFRHNNSTEEGFCGGLLIDSVTANIVGLHVLGSGSSTAPNTAITLASHIKN